MGIQAKYLFMLGSQSKNKLKTIVIETKLCAKI
jgi:hypothetical protein